MQELWYDSTKEVKYVATCEATKEAVRLRKFLHDLEVVTKMNLPNTLYCGNSEIALEHNIIDLFTKTLMAKVFEGHLESLGLRDMYISAPPPIHFFFFNVFPTRGRRRRPPAFPLLHSPVAIPSLCGGIVSIFVVGNLTTPAFVCRGPSISELPLGHTHSDAAVRPSSNRVADAQSLSAAMKRSRSSDSSKPRSVPDVERRRLSLVVAPVSS
ncbi:retrovirus-related pol polyprotein from transposon tnt 1-94 [Cucumis melo var. makuwa]|uniref:Retrovirus-related pol polyprotein from transposon tnt 1-94 n=1 Tax=Cucumis melo var. makuwa TaxID=1194695 RepID=A0A5A7T733_CUCMM|nr:retrovirus-related pol polyprotein from transposon tnt 1-94 [Cucumis melo var. makuwa]